MKSQLFSQFHHPGGIHSVVFEDDGRVAYAYITENAQIVGDVWLYNRCATPEQPEWHGKGPMPFANAREYVIETSFDPPASEQEVKVEWSRSEPGKPVRASLFIRDSLHATLTVGEKPARCCLAAKDGPLAKVLAE